MTDVPLFPEGAVPDEDSLRLPRYPDDTYEDNIDDPILRKEIRVWLQGLQDRWELPPDRTPVMRNMVFVQCELHRVRASIRDCPPHDQALRDQLLTQYRDLEKILTGQMKALGIMGQDSAKDPHFSWRELREAALRMHESTASIYRHAIGCPGCGRILSVYALQDVEFEPDYNMLADALHNGGGLSLDETNKAIAAFKRLGNFRGMWKRTVLHPFQIPWLVGHDPQHWEFPVFSQPMREMLDEKVVCEFCGESHPRLTLDDVARILEVSAFGLDQTIQDYDRQTNRYGEAAPDATGGDDTQSQVGV